jgi:hemin uptake protein HemP
MKHVIGKIIVRVNHEGKNSHKMEDGTVLRLERGWNNLNRREVSPVNATVVSGEDLKEDAEILISHNAVHETFRITNHGQLSGQKIADRIEYYSIPENNAFLWLDGQTWKPLKGFATGLRVFRPYTGPLVGIEPKKIKDTLLITSGALTGKVCHTLRAADYEIIFQNTNGKEGNIIRFRHSDDEEIEQEELVCINHGLTKELKSGKIWAGLTATDCKPLKELAHV